MWMRQKNWWKGLEGRDNELREEFKIMRWILEKQLEEINENEKTIKKNGWFKTK